MQKIGRLLIAICLLAAGVKAQQKTAIPGRQTPGADVMDRPKLVVGIVVDQMRWDYLYRYYPRFGEGGFRRLLGEGFSCENTFINYLPSYTAVGHTTIFTGSVPAISGITGNDWTDQLTGRPVYCTDDSTVQPVGTNSPGNKMSPRNLWASTITDELRLATNFQSRVVGLSLKDRAAILPAGHTANAAFWLDDASGHFITSSYYMRQLPDWINKFNEREPIRQLIGKGWNTLYPLASYTSSDADNQPYEGRFNGETGSGFPHAINEVYPKNKGSFRSTPFGNTLTLQFAGATIDGYGLGAGKATDFLTVNCASTDYVGHMFGPNSIEVEDTYLRLDKDLADFLRQLDNKIGKGNYLVFLTADHGAAHAIGFMQQHQLPADYWSDKPLVNALNKLLEQQFRSPGLVLSLSNYQVNFNMKKIEEGQLDYTAIKKATVKYLQQQPGINFAMDVDELGNAPIPQPVKMMVANGYAVKRSGGVQLILNAGWFEGYGKTGTTHGSWNPYDTHIPLLWYGWNVPQGKTNRQVYMTDIAATLAAMLHVQMPNGSIGQVITEVVR